MRTLDFESDADRAVRLCAEIEQIVDDAQDTLTMPGMLQRGLARTFLEAYIDGPQFDPARVGRVGACAAELRLQEALLLTTGASSNMLVIDPLLAEQRDVNAPESWPAHLQVMTAAIDQDLIGKSRILWERFMNLVFVVELGELWTGSGSKRGRFFGKFIDDHARWGFLSEYQPLVVQLDDEYRTREFHHGSIIRSQLLAGGRLDVNRVLGLTGPLRNMMWPNLSSLVSGGDVVVRTVPEQVANE